MAAITNALQSAAASDLGLGDQLSQQVQDEDEERRKALREGQSANPGLFGDATLSPAAMSLFGAPSSKGVGPGPGY